MRWFLLSLLTGFVCVSSAYADDQEEVAKVSVRLFHDVCLGSVSNPDKVAELLTKFPPLPKEKADMFRERMEASDEAQVTAFNFPKANFVAIIDPKKGKCDLVGDRQVRFDDVKAEFDSAIKGFSSVDGMDVSGFEVNKSSLMNSLRYSYNVPAKGISFGIYASAKAKDVEPGQMGTIYTMFAMPLKLKD